VGSAGRAASAGAVAPEPPRATRSTPEFIRDFSKKYLFFLICLCSARTGPAKPKSQKCEFSRLNSKMAKQTSQINLVQKYAVEKQFDFSPLNSNFQKIRIQPAELKF